MSTEGEVPPDYPNNIVSDINTNASALETIKCRVCLETMTATEEYRKHLFDFHYELLTDDELNGIVTVERI